MKTLCSLLVSTLLASAAAAAQAGKKPVNVFVLAGQSNMAGAGTIEVEQRTINTLRSRKKPTRVRCVDTRPFYRPPEQSPGTGDIEHWHSNAESCFLIGKASGAAMLELLNQWLKLQFADEASSDESDGIPPTCPRARLDSPPYSWTRTATSVAAPYLSTSVASRVTAFLL